MATVPSSATLATWLGAGASTQSGTGYFIPAALVGTPVGNDSPTITDDIRDLLFSVLTLCEKTYSQQIATTDTRPTKISITKNLDNLSNPKKVSFFVTLEASTITQPVDSITLPSYS
jgi:hypothetical protein